MAVTAGALLVAKTTAAPAEPWPAFVMVYADTKLDRGVPVTQTFRLEYTDTRHFTTILTGHTKVPEAVGWTHTVDGRNSGTTDPRLGVVQQRPSRLRSKPYLTTGSCPVDVRNSHIGRAQPSCARRVT